MNRGGTSMGHAIEITRRRFWRTAMVAAGGGAVAVAEAKPGRAQEGLPQVEPAALRIDARVLGVADDPLERWTSGQNAPVPGGAIRGGRAGKRLAPRYFGRQGPEADAEPIRRDAMFYMASVTKPVICTAAMLLVERGQLNLSDPVQRYIPEFAGRGKEAAQVLHLFTHTSGLPDELPNNTELRSQLAPLSRFIEGSI